VGEGVSIEHLDLGGGLGIRYQAEEHPPTIAEYVQTLLSGLGGRSFRILIEPGRSMVGNAGLLLTRTEYVKPTPERCFVIIDAAMNDLVRPALYDAWHDIPSGASPGACGQATVSGRRPGVRERRLIGRDRMLSVEAGDLLAVLSAGAYGMSMSSNYNSRPRAAEVMIDGEHAHLIRSRETITSCSLAESFLPLNSAHASQAMIVQDDHADDAQTHRVDHIECRIDAVQRTRSAKKLDEPVVFDLKFEYNALTKHPSSRHEWIQRRRRCMQSRMESLAV